MQVPELHPSLWNRGPCAEADGVAGDGRGESASRNHGFRGHSAVYDSENVGAVLVRDRPGCFDHILTGHHSDASGSNVNVNVSWESGLPLTKCVAGRNLLALIAGSACLID